MRIELITLHCVKNYGSVLQTYATQEYFKKLGFEVEIIDYRRHDLQDPYFYVNKGIDALKKQKKSSITRKIYKTISSKMVAKKIEVFDGFLKKFIDMTENTYISEQDIIDNLPKADVYCVGSDQTWNSYCNHGFEKPFFLGFVPENKKKISFSSSFGKSELDKDEKEITKKYLQKFNAISVRENSGLSILNDLGISNGVHILDPTLLLTNEEWSKLTDKSLVPKRQYLLIYELGKNKLLNEIANKIAKQKNLKIVRIGIGFSQIIHKDTKLYPQVQEWLSLFKYADYVVTDSFHGTAFSINFNKRFSVVYPKNFRNRLQSILELCNLENRAINSLDSLNKEYYEISYTDINSILDEERKKTKNFLYSSTGMEENASEGK